MNNSTQALKLLYRERGLEEAEIIEIIALVDRIKGGIRRIDDSQLGDDVPLTYAPMLSDCLVGVNDL